MELKITKSGITQSVSASEGSLLIDLLRKAGYEVYAPCGGNGVCGKCRVHLKGEGQVLACHHILDKSDTEVILPGERESRILVEQSKNTVQIFGYPGNFDHLSMNPHGIAIDIGTTSIVIYLVNLVTTQLIETRSFLNPQGQFGADVISRIQHTMEHEDGLKELQDVLIGRINEHIVHLAKTVTIKTSDIVKASIAGNTTMLHILAGEDPKSISFAPFTPLFVKKRILNGKQLKLESHPEAEITLLPSLSGYVGADITAGIATLSELNNNALFIDVGTNGEMALLTKDKIFACSTAAGPAFEGANISCGLGSVEGAISAYESETIETIGNASPIGICGSGLIDIVAHVVDSGHSDHTGYMENAFVLAEKTEINAAIEFSPKDMREVQMAKGAIAAGIQIMLKEAGLEEKDVDVLYLAGGFGNHINIKNAIRIGMLPASLEEKIIPIGNAAGTGALLALKAKEFEKRIEDVIDRMAYIELSSRMDFNMEYVMNMEFQPSVV